MDQDLYIYPGITKNLTKTMCGKLKRFIKKQFKDRQNIMQDPKVQEFLGTSQYDYKVVHIQRLKESKIGKTMADFFFGNLIWCQDLSELNKLDVNYYFQFNHVWYGNEDEPKQKIVISVENSKEEPDYRQQQRQGHQQEQKVKEDEKKEQQVKEEDNIDQKIVKKIKLDQFCEYNES